MYCVTWQVTHNPKPIPSREWDWDWCHKDYEGPGDKRCGCSPSMAAALAEIRTLEEEPCYGNQSRYRDGR
jgi:hypothetical protein